ncbi:hypothetical protein BDW22DRAFT_973828 [Trametopsis cervina]|nr:hypothetical protein BDW22DRAFT_973828 [Trametopsis cervina]
MFGRYLPGRLSSDRRSDPTQGDETSTGLISQSDTYFFQPTTISPEQQVPPRHDRDQASVVLPPLRIAYPEDVERNAALPQLQNTGSRLQPVAHPPSTPGETSRPPRRYVCGVCGRSFPRPSSLRTHGYSHSGEKQTIQR